MAKKIFKVIAITLASIIGFAGVVFGVLALMGKFKEPVVYPEELTFLESEQTIVYDGEANNKYSFTLTGTASGDHVVNRRVCYLSFDQGEDLITLLDSNGEELEHVENTLYYKVLCNEPIYYKVNGNAELDVTKAEFGKVVMKARDERERVRSNTQTIWIDRAVTDVYLKDYKYDKTPDLASQEISLNINQELSFAQSSFYALPEYSLNPISAEQAKNVKVYYDDQTGRDLIEISEELPFIEKDEDENLYFKSSESGTSYKFVVAVFNSYKAESDYVGTNLQYPNQEKVDNMVSTILNVSVANKDIDSVEIKEQLNLNLYKETEFSLTDIGLTMTKDGEITDRFNEASFTLNENRVWQNTNLKFENSDASKTITFIDSTIVKITGFDNLADGSYTYSISINGGNISINTLNLTINYGSNSTDNKRITINSKNSIRDLTFGLDNFTCVNGSAFVENNHLTMLKTGSYLDFFTTDADNYSLANEFNYEPTQLTTTGTKSFSILTKNYVSELQLGVLVVNSDGKMYSAFQIANVLPVETDPTFKTKNVNLNINYVKNGDVVEPSYEEFALTDLINENNSSYNAFVMITPSGNSCVETLNNFNCTISDQQYVLVGYLNEAGAFVNSIKVNENAETKTCSIYLLRLKNAFEQSAEDLIENSTQLTDIVAGDVNTYVNDSYEVKVNLNYEFNPDFVDIAYDDDDYILANDDVLKILENTKSHTLKLTSSCWDMLVKADITLEDISILMGGNVIDTSSLVIDSLVIEDAVLNNQFILITFNVGDARVNRENVEEEFEIQILPKNANRPVKTKPIVVANSEPTDIVLNLEEDNVIKLYTSSDDANQANTYLKILISYNTETAGYDYKYCIVQNGEEEGYHPLNEIAQLFNKKTNGTSGFIGNPQYAGFEFDIIYTLANGDLFDLDNLQVKGVGETTLAISIGSVTKYFGFKITTDENFEFKAEQNYSVQNTTATIKDFVTYEYQDEDLASLIEIDFNSLKGAIGGEPLEISPLGGNYENGCQLTHNGSVILNITKNGDGIWQFSRSSEQNSTLTLNFDVKVLTHSAQRVNLSFISALMVDVNTDYFENLYADTTVLMYEIITEKSELKNQPYFIITNKTGDDASITVKFSKGNTIESDMSATLMLEEGTYTVNFYQNEVEFASKEITVLPNVIISDKTDLTLESYTDYSDFVPTYFTLESYKNDITYGVQDFYTKDQLETLSYTTSLSIKEVETLGDDGSDILTFAGNTLTTGWIEKISDFKTVEIQFVYNNKDLGAGNVKFADGVVQLTITNKYDKYFKNLNSYELMAFVGSDKFVNNLSSSISGLSLTKIEVNESFSTNKTIEFNTAGKAITLTTAITEKINNIPLIFTFNINSKTLTYKNTDNINEDLNITISLTPYKPEQNATSAVMGENVNLIKDVLTITDAGTGDVKTEIANNVESIKITEISNKNALANYEIVIGSGYENGSSLEDIPTALLAKLQENEIKLTIYYTISYTTGGEFVFSYELTIKNEMSLNITYPYSDLSAQNVSFAFVAGEDAEHAKSALDKDGDGTIDQPFNYEPVSMGQTITFGYDENLNITRSTNAQNTEDDLKISLVAYFNEPLTRNYYLANNIEINESLKSVTFRNSAVFTYGYFIFKLTTSTGYSAYYFVRLQNISNYVADDYSFTSKDVQSDALATYAGVLDTLDLTKDFKLKNVSTDNISLYILNATGLDGSTFKYGDVNYSGTTLENDVEVGYARYSKVNAETMPSVKNYTNVKLALVYKNSSTEFCIGTVNLYLKPEGVTVEKVAGDVKYISGVDTGEYTYERTNGTGKFANPFTVTGCTFESLEIESENETDGIVSVGADNSINFEKYINNRNLEFTAVYTYNIDSANFVLKLHITYKGLELDLSKETLTVGEFKKESGFNTKLSISEYFGEYKGEVNIIGKGLNYTIDLAKNKITSNDNGSMLSYETGKYYLTFTQSSSAQKIEFTMTFTDLAGSYSKQFEINVKENYSVQAETSPNSGNLQSLALYATANGTYTSKVGGYIDIEKTEGSSYYSYKIGGLTFYCAKNSSYKIKIELSNARYSANDNSAVEFSVGGQFNFIHMPIDSQIVHLTISLINGSDSLINRDFYVRLPQTYVTLQAQYLLQSDNDAIVDHENVASGSNITIDELFNSKVDNNYLNKYRFKLIVLKDGRQQEAEGFNLSAMGFTDQNNLNYISDDYVVVGDNASYTSSGRKITFSQVETNTLSTLSLKNELLPNPFTYQFQIMADAVDGFNFNGDAVYGTDYASINYNDLKNNQSKQVRVAEWKDARNTILYLKSIGEKTPQSTTGNLPFNIAEKAYSFVDDFGTLQISLNAQKQLIVELVDPNSEFKKLQFSLTFVGNGGQDVCLNIYFFNYEIGAYSAVEQYAGENYSLANIITLPEDLTLEYLENESTFTYKRDTYECGASNPYKLFTVDAGNKTLNLFSVSEDATLNLKFAIKDGDVIVKEVSLTVTQKRNIQFKINDETLPYGNTFDSNYILNNANDSNLTSSANFPYSEDLASQEHNDNGTITYGNVIYLKDLWADVYSINKDSKIEDLTIRYSLRDSYDGVSIKDNKIEFSKDFTGVLRLTLSVTTRAGVSVEDLYSVNWDINVQGFVNYVYNNTTHSENYIMRNSGTAFAGGTSVNVISNLGNALGCAITTSNTFADEKIKVETPEFTYDVNYVVIDSKTSINASEEFANNSRTQAEIVKNEKSQFGFSTKLPYVVTGDNAYIVIYQIKITYLGQISQTYYANYYVSNNSSITPSETNKSINVDSELTSKGNASNYLQLFCYKDEITFQPSESGDAFNGILIYLSNKNYQLNISDGTHAGTWTSLNGVDFTKEESDETLTISSNGTYTLGEGHGSYTSNISSESFFNHTFKNVSEFAQLVDSAYVEFSDMKNYNASEDAQIYFKLEYIENGYFGIHLTEPYKDSSTTELIGSKKPLFNNELNAVIKVFTTLNNKAVVQANLTLTSSNKITPKGQFELSEIFPVGTYKEEDADKVIIGVGESAQKNWVETGEIKEDSNSDANATVIKIGQTQYKLYSVTYSSDASSDLYSISEKFYYVTKEGGNQFIFLVYNPKAADYSTFTVNYADNQDSTADLTGKFIKYFNDDNGTFTKETYKNDGDFPISVSSENPELNDALKDINDPTSITLTHDNLIEIKNNNPDKTYVDINFTAVHDGVTVNFVVTFYLPPKPMINVNLNSEVNISSLKIPVINDDVKEFASLSENYNKVRSVEEVSSTYTTISLTQNDSDDSHLVTGVTISLNLESISAYFTNNNEAKYLDINITITTTDNLTLSFVIRVNKAESE